MVEVKEARAINIYNTSRQSLAMIGNIVSRGRGGCRGALATCMGGVNAKVMRDNNAILKPIMTRMFHAQTNTTLIRPLDNRQARNASNINPLSCTSTRMFIMSRSNAFSTSSETSSALFTKSEYIHPLSQIVLERLQSHHSHWVQYTGLDRGLKLNKDGTFVLRFPTGDDDGGGGNGIVEDGEGGENTKEQTGSISGSIW